MKREYKSKPEGEWKLAKKQNPFKLTELSMLKIRKDMKKAKEFIKREVPEREPTNRERIIALMADRVYYIDYFQDIIDHPEKSEHPENDYRPIVRENTRVYNALRDLLASTEFQSDDVDEPMAVLILNAQKSTVPTETKEDLLEAYHYLRRAYQHWNPNINATSHHKLYFRSREIPKEEVKESLGYKRYVEGNNEILGLIPIDEREHKPLYLGSKIRYKQKSGDTRFARITGFTLPVSVSGARHEHVYGLDIENGTPISLRMDQIIDVSRG